MAADFYTFEKIYKERLGELLLPVLQSAIEELCSEGGKIWEYISELVVEGVNQHVYAAYHTELPYYIRRGSSGGLGDPENVVITITNGVIDGDWINFDGELMNITPPGDTDFTGAGDGAVGGGMIEDQIIGGYGYSFNLPKHNHYTGSFLQPRDFYRVYEDEFDPNTAWGFVLDKIGPELQEIQEMALESALFETFKI
jgi:hypothetical protein